MTDLFREAFVDGKWIAGPVQFPVRDPFDDDLICNVTDAGDELIDAAVNAAAAQAFAGWRALPGPERGRLLRAVGEGMRADEDGLAFLCTRENGKPLAESVAEVRYAASFLAWFGGEAERAYGEVIPASRADQRLIVTREPVGPCALITPWNFPYAMLTRKLGAALAAGDVRWWRSPRSRRRSARWRWPEVSAEQRGRPGGRRQHGAGEGRSARRRAA